MRDTLSHPLLPQAGAQGAAPCRWSLRRSSVAPAQFMAGMGIMAAIAVLVGLAGAAYGLWAITAWCVVELAFIALAGGHFARHARDGEDIELRADGTLVVEVHDGERVSRHVFDRGRARVIRHRAWSAADESLWLHCGRRQVRLARYLDRRRTCAFETDIRQALGTGPSRAPRLGAADTLFE